MSGPAPKPSHLRQRRNKKAGATELAAANSQESNEVPKIPNPDKRKWHPLTLKWWGHVWKSPMAGEYLETDTDGLGRVAILIDDYYASPDAKLLGEIRLQEARFGLSPLDRSRLQWEISKAKVAKRRRKTPTAEPSRKVTDPRKTLRAVK